MKILRSTFPVGLVLGIHPVSESRSLAVQCNDEIIKTVIPDQHENRVEESEKRRDVVFVAVSEGMCHKCEIASVNKRITVNYVQFLPCERREDLRLLLFPAAGRFRLLFFLCLLFKQFLIKFRFTEEIVFHAFLLIPQAPSCHRHFQHLRIMNLFPHSLSHDLYA